MQRGRELYAGCAGPYLERTRGSRGPGNRKGPLSTDPGAEPQSGREGVGEHGGDRDSQVPSLNTWSQRELRGANTRFLCPLHSPGGSKAAEQPREDLQAPGRRGPERGEGAQNKVSLVPIRAADCTGVTACMNQ